jgi:hypothetical protein
VGVGGKTLAIGKPVATGEGFAVAAAATATGLVAVTNWASGSAFARFVNVVPAR